MNAAMGVNLPMKNSAFLLMCICRPKITSISLSVNSNNPNDEQNQFEIHYRKITLQITTNEDFSISHNGCYQGRPQHEMLLVHFKYANEVVHGCCHVPAYSEHGIHLYSTKKVSHLVHTLKLVVQVSKSQKHQNR